jgi:membrane-associated protease RseP (regulator of RpoE activity)
MHYELFRERLCVVVIIVATLLTGLRAPANGEEPAPGEVETEKVVIIDDGSQSNDPEDVLVLNTDGADEASGLRDALRAVDVEGSGALQIEALPAGNILSVRAEPTLSDESQQKYWIGVQLRDVDSALRSHLKLGEREGLLVGEVFADSPGAKAGLKPHDVIVSAGEKKIAEAGDLIRTVEESGGKELGLRVIRGGKEEQVKVTPAERPKEQTTETKTESDDVRRWIGELKLDGAQQLLGLATRNPGDVYRYSIVRPSEAIVLSGRSTTALPEGTSITITREGKNPAKISVKREAGTWDITEEEMSKLPEDVRPLVERMLGRGQAGPARFRRQLAEPPTVQLAPPAAVPRTPAPPLRVERERLVAPPERVRALPPPVLRQADDKIKELEDRLKKLEDELRKK